MSEKRPESPELLELRRIREERGDTDPVIEVHSFEEAVQAVSEILGLPEKE